MYNSVIQLVKETSTTNEYGDIVTDQSERQVFADVRSIGMKEFYQAKSSGFEPEIKFVLADYYDYDFETLVRYEGRTYNVIRTYRTGNELEIICKRGVDV